MTVVIPMRLPSAANLREHHMVRHRRVKEQRRMVAVFLGGKPRPALPLVVTLTRSSPGKLDSDNLQGAFKAVRDEVAKWMGVDDADSRVTWVYTQTRGPYGISIGFSESAGCVVDAVPA